MKIVFAGSPYFAVPALEALNKAYGVAAVITQPDKPLGRKQILTPTFVKRRALELGIPVYDFAKIRDRAAEIRALGADIMITCAYGQLLTQEILDCFKGGVWNIHASLLPKYRGASPIQAAMLAGETHTGITVMKTELSLDTGDILLVEKCEIGGLTYGYLSEKLSRLGAVAAVKAVEYLQSGQTQLLVQDDAKATYCKKISKAQGRINFCDTSVNICRLIKAFSPEPAAFCRFNGNGADMNIFDAEICEAKEGKNGEVITADKHGIKVKCGEGGIMITELQAAGGKRMRAADFVNGRKIKAGDILE